jgi:branched-chain amino acid transport system substrate-binding protein
VSARIACALAALALAAGLAAGPGAAAQPPPVVLGVTTSLRYLEGADSLRAALLAVEEINAAGGVEVAGVRRRLELAPLDLDDASPGAEAARVARRLERFLAGRTVHAIVVGPFRSEVLLSCLEVIARHRVPLLGTIAMTAATEELVMRQPRFRYVFRVGLDSSYLVEYLAQAMAMLEERYGWRRVFIINQDVAWARATAGRLVRVFFKPRGWRVLGQENVPSGAEEFAPVLKQARRLGAQVILPIFDMPQSSYLVEQWASRRVPALICGFISPLAGPGAWQAFGGKVDGLLNLAFELGNLPSARHPPSVTFYRAFQRRFGQPIQAGHGPAPAYEAVHILAEAIARAGSLDPEALVDELEATDRAGVMGRVRFHPGHQAIFGDHPDRAALACLFQWRPDGRRVIVHPAAVAEGRVELPEFVRPPAPSGDKRPTGVTKGDTQGQRP